VTSLTAPGHLARALEAGVDELIDKPIHPDDLDAAIGRLIGERIGVYDATVALARASGDPELLASALQLFLAEVPGHLAAIGSALEQRDGATICRHAQDVAEAAHALAMPRLQDLAYRIAHHGDHGDLERAAEAATDLASAFGRARSAVEPGLEGE
jgi:HPt (histidine-containing phosphotransfer) domain-containing protein